MTLDETEGRIWAANHRAFADWADAVLARIAAAARRRHAATLLSAIAAVGLSLTMIGGTIA
jgi:hypothetical protein